MTTTTERIRSDYLTAALAGGTTSTDDFADLVLTDASVERVQESLASGFTRALFNGSEAAGRLGKDAEEILPTLIETYRQCGDPTLWKVVEEAEADLPTTLELIRMEIVESIGETGLSSREALTLLAEALKEDNDTLHFAVFTAVSQLGSKASDLAAGVERYLAGLDNRELPTMSKPHLRVAATEALSAIQ